MSEVARVIPTAGTGEDLPALANVQMRTDWYGLTMVAADRYRVAQATIQGSHIPGQGIRAGKALIEAALLRKLAKHLPSGVLIVGVHEERLMLSSGFVTVVSSTGEEEFIAVEAVMPKTAMPMSVTVNRKALTAAITKATNILGASSEGHGMSVGVLISPDTMSVAPKLERAVAPTFPPTRPAWTRQCRCTSTRIPGRRSCRVHRRGAGDTAPGRAGNIGGGDRTG